MSAKNEHGLTPQQERFAQEVAKGSSLAESYRIAYPKSQKWAEASLWTEASRLMSKPKVIPRVKALSQKAEEVFAVDAARLLREACRIAFSDVSKIMHEDGRMKLPHELDPDTRAAVASIKVDEAGRIEYKFWDKNSSHERLFKHKALYAAEYAQQAEVAAKLVTRIELVGVVPQAK